MPKLSTTYFMDYMKRRKRDYTILTEVLDDALFDFNYSGGHIMKKVIKGGRVHFIHVIDFCCKQRSTLSATCGYYISSHMDEYVWGHRTFKLPKGILKWSKNLEQMPYDWSVEFEWIQNVYATIINKDVIMPTRIFYGVNDTSEDRAACLQAQADNMPALSSCQPGFSMTQWKLLASLEMNTTVKTSGPC